MEKRETHKIVEISGRKWRIEKFDAFTGSYIAYKVLGATLPMGLEEKVKGEKPSMDKMPVMSKQEFFELQLDCLRVCSEVLPAGSAKVIGDNGAWGVMNVEHDTVLVLALTAHALIFNVSAFFDGEALKGLVGSFAGLKFFNAPM